MEGPDGIVVAVSRSLSHLMAKTDQARIGLVAGQGVEDDTPMGEKVRHRYPVKRNPEQPNLYQVHRDQVLFGSRSGQRVGADAPSGNAAQILEEIGDRLQPMIFRRFHWIALLAVAETS
jgi:hypothetical protein